MLKSSTSFARGEHREIASRSMLPFRHVDRLGIGMSAMVEIVKDNATGQIFAHKAFRQYYGPEPEKFKQEFQNEINIMKRLHAHPHIIKIHWSYACGNELGVLLSPVARDGDLRAYLRRIQDVGEPLTTEQHSVLSRSFGCLASGLAYIHNHTIRHKDIKPQNILVHDGHMIYTDFGIALDASEQDTTTTGRPEAFTDRYCAPEVANWEPRNRKSDVFSLGCVFIEIMAYLSPDTNLITSDPRPYRHRIDDLQSILIHLGANDTKLGQLFLSFHNMLEPGSVDRLNAEALLCRLRSIQDSQLNLGYKFFCKDCENFEIDTPQEAMEEEEIASSNKEVDGLYENPFTEKVDRPSNILAFNPSRDTLLLQIAIKLVVQKPLPERHRSASYIYICWQLRYPNLIRFGITKDVPRQLEQWERNCKRRVQEYKQQSKGERVLIANARRVEELARLELRDFQSREDRCEGCNVKHLELYRTTPEYAAKVIKKYSDWMAKGPYEPDQAGEDWKLNARAWRNGGQRVCRPVPFEETQTE